MDPSASAQSNPSASSDPPSDAPGDVRPSQAFGDVAANAMRLKEALWLYLSARRDKFRLGIRNLAFLAILALLAGLIFLSAIVTATVLLCMGIAGALSTFIGGERWRGDLAFGLLTLILLGIGTWVVLSLVKEKSRRKTVAKYQALQRNQRERHEQDSRSSQT